jgi:hypothetical protein
VNANTAIDAAICAICSARAWLHIADVEGSGGQSANGSPPRANRWVRTANREFLPKFAIFQGENQGREPRTTFFAPPLDLGRAFAARIRLAAKRT